MARQTAIAVVEEAPVEKKRPKTAFPEAIGRGTIHYFDPRPPSEGGCVVFVGVDEVEDAIAGPEHICWSVTKRNTTISESMARSIDAQGVQAPVIVRKNGIYAEIVVGRRRLFNLREVNRRRAERGEEPLSLPGIKFEGTDEQLIELMLTENLDREDESDVEQARLAVRLLKTKPKAYVAAICHCSPASLNTLLKVLDLCPEVQAETGRGLFLSRDAAVKMVDLTFDKQREMLKELKASVGESGRATAREVTERAAPNTTLKPKGSQVKRLIAMLEADAKKKMNDRYFQYDDSAKFLAKILRVCQGEIKANTIKGLVDVFEDRIVIE